MSEKIDMLTLASEVKENLSLEYQLSHQVWLVRIFELMGDQNAVQTAIFRLYKMLRPLGKKDFDEKIQACQEEKKILSNKWSGCAGLFQRVKKTVIIYDFEKIFDCCLELMNDRKMLLHSMETDTF